ncbi:ribonuclease III domain-containing protein [Mycoplasmopsis gallinacea]|uniref:Ribonuclease 3 n=1 Tax=Mycoplasmopsis gallinacea TaxID=29556 RepID=A0A449A3D9_9BACT|nr:ribonuclease III domain-containing protein [Mycoplasmopsis gallinacea]VEU58759.1 Ribonuclease III [Mycoplasmopsis gallinacea]
MRNLNDYIEVVESQIGYEFQNKELLYQAFTRRSFSIEEGGENNEVLEFIGDTVLNLYVTKILMDKYGFQNDWDEFATRKYKTEGSLTNLKKRLVNKRTLANRIEEMDLEDLLYMGKGDIKQKRHEEASVKEDLFEAILGAIAIDSNWDPKSLEESVEMMLNIENLLDKNFKEEDYVTFIQEWNQKEHGEIPVYEFIDCYSKKRDPFDFGFTTIYIRNYENKKYLVKLSLSTPRGQKLYQVFSDSKSEGRRLVAKEAYDDLWKHDELWTINDECPEDLTLRNSISTLHNLAQKGYISMPEYDIPEEELYDEDGDPFWEVTCEVKSEDISWTASWDSKKQAKRYAAYLCLCEIFGLEDEYENK